MALTGTALTLATAAAALAGVPLTAGALAIAFGVSLIAGWPLKDPINDLARELGDWMMGNKVPGVTEAPTEEMDPVWSHPVRPYFDPNDWAPRRIDEMCDRNFDAAKGWRQPVDPLMLDLDGDGLELSRAGAQILFDHNADGIRTGTGWIGADDGILVRDLNGNGTIDSGRELFGTETIKSNGKKATSGFDALADLDSNKDGQFTSADAAWNQVKVWRDLNQDGITDAGELFSLDDLGISRIGVAGSTTDGQAGSTVNGNFVAQSGSFTRDGQNQEIGTVDLGAGSVDLDNNPFYRDYIDDIPLSEQAKALPQMQGSGRVRDLGEAVTLSPAVASILSVFSAKAPTTTRPWSRTSASKTVRAPSAFRSPA